MGAGDRRNAPVVTRGIIEEQRSCDILSTMDIGAILRELDLEIAKLQRIRAIVQTLDGPARPRVTRPRTRSKSKPITAAPPMRKAKPTLWTAPVPVSTEPKLIILPPKTKREYQRKVRPALKETRALAAAIPARPVFVPRSTAARPVELPQKTHPQPESLEAAIRQNLLGVAKQDLAQDTLAAD